MVFKSGGFSSGEEDTNKAVQAARCSGFSREVGWSLKQEGHYCISVNTHTSSVIGQVSGDMRSWLSFSKDCLWPFREEMQFQC